MALWPVVCKQACVIPPRLLAVQPSPVHDRDVPGVISDRGPTAGRQIRGPLGSGMLGKLRDPQERVGRSPLAHGRGHSGDIRHLFRDLEAEETAPPAVPYFHCPAKMAGSSCHSSRIMLLPAGNVVR